MKPPRDISGVQLAKTLHRLGYDVTRQKGGHIRLTTQERSEHHITIPHHDPLKPGTLNNILQSIAIHFDKSRKEIERLLFS
ncbi:MAG: type II toxin-antitoxin system HicA family toxin [Candidatus Omnitrophota bacterium]